MPNDTIFHLRGTVSSERDEGYRPPKGEVSFTRRTLSPGTSRGEPERMPELAADQVVRVELENGLVFWSRVDDLLRERGQAITHRNGLHSWDIAYAPPRGAVASRGLLRWAIKVLDVFGVDIDPVEAVSSKLASTFEEHQLSGPPGIYQCSLTDTDDQGPELTPWSAARLPASDGPILVFLHGTASSCAGSFGGLWASDNPAGRKLRNNLHDRHGEAVYALEHRSLTESPITNALNLAEILPDNAELHLVSHSRGGLVGELLCLGQRDKSDSDPLSNQLVKELFAADRTMAKQLGLGPLGDQALEARDEKYAKDRDNLNKLRDLLDNKQIRVTRFVRVACPARGTTLASGRLDRWLSILDMVTGNNLFGATIDFLLAVVKERTDPRTLPGIEAMMPGSALTRLLAHPSLKVDADLSVIGGDIEGESLLGQLKLLIVDWFYNADHDLVVNTGSMSGGLRRIDGNARYRLDRGSHVSHFNYFHNRGSVQWLEQGLIRPDGDDGGFLPIGAAPAEPPRWREAVARSQRVSTPRPIALVLPGTMGSSLWVEDEQVWLNYWKLAVGGLRQLRMRNGHDGVVPVDLLDNFYGPLLEYLSGTHSVHVFPYDWRESVFDAATRLVDMLEPLVKRAEHTHQPVHLVAHSMGGLVVRAMMADGGEGSALWQRIRRIEHSRFMMLGTPNHGSHEAVRWLVGQNPTELKLALLDFTRGVDGVVDIVRQFPGLIELLPFAPAGTDFADADLWIQLKEALDADWKSVPAAVLRRARRSWDRLLDSPSDPQHMIYVAGCQARTVAGYWIVEDDGGWFGRASKQIAYDAVAEGDGTVTWESGRLPSVPTYYVDDTAHDELCTQRRAFAAYLDLLSNGSTTRLPTTAPYSKRDAGGAQRFRLTERPYTDAIPGPEDMRCFTFSGQPARKREDTSSTLPRIRVSVTHGDLAYARHPVMVGHYWGDTIVSAEAALDSQLGGALRRRAGLGLYPGKLRSHAVIFNQFPERSPKGAIVIGLGQVGELNRGLLEASARDAIIEFILQVANWPGERFNQGEGPRSASLSLLLIGTGAGMLPVKVSIEALLNAVVAAAERLERQQADADSGQWGKPVVIDEVEFIELYQDTAMDAYDAVSQLVAEDNADRRMVLESAEVTPGSGRRRRVRRAEEQEWWQRLEIYEDSAAGGLRYVFASARARAEQTRSFGQLSLAEAFVRETSASPSADTEVSRSLFEMLLPNRLKELAPAQTNLVLLVDSASARYPWELLEDRWSSTGRPPAVNGGLVRQLRTPNFRASPSHAIDAKALVVGEPELAGAPSFAPLPGARAEAVEVARVLRAGGFGVHESLGQSAADILHGLHRDAWRVLHLAGHGVHDDEDPKRSGMLIGRGKLLTPGDVEQMRWVPELVFINCCHLARTDRPHDHFTRLAANLAEQFIRMGVRAVVAAGWAVDDAAAKEFASRFYAAMSRGDSFGEAVRIARQSTWLNHPRVNTWGAYQCYGDPSYCLQTGKGKSAPAKLPPWRSPAELVAELENQTEQARVRRGTPENSEKMQDAIDASLRRISEDLYDAWTRRADVAAAIGLAWGEIKQYENAIEWLNNALKSDIGDCPVRALEQCANFQIRWIGEQWLGMSPARQTELRPSTEDKINGAIRQLAAFCERSPNIERYNLLGSACKLLAMVMEADASPRIEEALLNMAQYYRNAYEDSDAKGEPSSGAFTNWATARVILAHLRKDSPGWQPAFDRECADVIALVRGRNQKQPALRNALGESDCELARWLGKVDDALTYPAIAQLYDAALSRGASARQRGLVIEHIDFCIEMVKRIDDGGLRSSLLPGLGHIRKRVA